MKKNFYRGGLFILMFSFLLSSCKKDVSSSEQQPGNETALKVEAQNTIDENINTATSFKNDFDNLMASSSSLRRGSRPDIVTIASSLPIFKSLTAAVIKTGLAETLATPGLGATVFAPTDAAFAKLPAPFNNAVNISAITDAAQIEALKNVLLYHVLGTEVKRLQISKGTSSAVTLKPAGEFNDNTIYLSNTFGLIAINGNTLVLVTDVQASNGIIHVINNVLTSPTQNIAQIATGNSAFSSLVAGLVKTNLVGIFAAPGDYTVFAPTDDAFSKLPAPFNNAANIAAITDQAQIDALANILKYHVLASRNFAIDFGIFQSITTLAQAPNNKVIGILGFNKAYVKGDLNKTFSKAFPANLLATNGVVHVIDQVLQP